MPGKSGYTYWKEVAVNHTGDGAQTNYQMKVLVGESSGATGEEVDCGGKCLSTFNDLWFQGYDGPEGYANSGGTITTDGLYTVHKFTKIGRASCRERVCTTV